jgi:xanthine/uracil permease
MGLGLASMPGVCEHMPKPFRCLFGGSAAAVCIIGVILLNVIFPAVKTEAPAVIEVD